MVHVHVFVLFATLTSAFALIPLAKRTTQDVLDAISKVDAAITKLDNLITAYPSSGGTLTEAFVRSFLVTLQVIDLTKRFQDIHTGFTELDSIVKSATTVVDVGTLPIQCVPGVQRAYLSFQG